MIKLYDYQEKIINKLFYKHAAGIFTDMGTGKTPMAVTLAARHQCDRIIVVTPNGKLFEGYSEGSWPWWIQQQYSSNMKIYFKNAKIYMSPKTSAYICNYEALYDHKKSTTKTICLNKSLKAYLHTCVQKNICVIFDESHKLKNSQALQTKAADYLCKIVKAYSKETYVYLLTGTPFTQGYIDLWSQLRFLDCNISKTAFVNAFCIRGNIPGLLGWQQPIVGYKNTNDLFKIVHEYAVTMKSEEVLSLPEQIFTYYKYSETKAMRAFSKPKITLSQILEVEHDFGLEDIPLLDGKTVAEHLANGMTKKSVINNPFFRNICYPSQEWLADTSGASWLRARQLSIGFNGNEQHALWYDSTRFDMIEEMLAIHETNYVIFYNFNAEINRLYDICTKLDYKIDVYNGKIKKLTYYNEYASADEETKRFMQKRVVIANFASGSTGLNLQQYNHCIIASLPTYGDWAQGLKRIHRAGQTKNTYYYIFMQDSWLDRSMQQALIENITYDSKLFEKDLQKNAS